MRVAILIFALAVCRFPTHSARIRISIFKPRPSSNSAYYPSNGYYYGSPTQPPPKPLTTSTTPTPSILLDELIKTIVGLDEASMIREISEIETELKTYAYICNSFRDIKSTAVMSIIKLLADENVGKVLVPFIEIVRERQHLAKMNWTRSITRGEGTKLIRRVFNLNIQNLNSELPGSIERFYCAFITRNAKISKEVVEQVLTKSHGVNIKALNVQNFENARLISKRISNLVKPYQEFFEFSVPCFDEVTSLPPNIGIDNIYSFILFLMHSLNPAPIHPY